MFFNSIYYEIWEIGFNKFPIATATSREQKDSILNFLKSKYPKNSFKVKTRKNCLFNL